jgi:2-keto-3-deoxy-galactonokinase
LGQDVRIIGETGIASAYFRALRAQGVAARALPADEMTRSGLIACSNLI